MQLLGQIGSGGQSTGREQGSFWIQCKVEVGPSTLGHTHTHTHTHQDVAGAPAEATLHDANLRSVNIQYKFVAELASALAIQGIDGVIENPTNSLLWSTSWRKSLVEGAAKLGMKLSWTHIPKCIFMEGSVVMLTPIWLQRLPRYPQRPKDGVPSWTRSRQAPKKSIYFLSSDLCTGAMFLSLPSQKSTTLTCNNYPQRPDGNHTEKSESSWSRKGGPGILRIKGAETYTYMLHTVKRHIHIYIYICCPLPIAQD